jgi:signal peptidase II
MKDGALPAGSSRPLRIGVGVLVVGFVLDQLTKLWVLKGTDLPDGGHINVAPFLDFLLVWNRGISYGLFQQDSELGRWALFAVMIAAAVGLSVWMVRATSRLLAASLGLIVGGAIGNAIDRVAYGAVFDFVHFHVGSFSWYVFNVADAAIVAGVVGLVYDSLVLDKRRERQANP